MSFQIGSASDLPQENNIYYPNGILKRRKKTPVDREHLSLITKATH